ncbi:ABC transporter permease [Streptomyces enissocaesilis]|uniref:Transport permease protein n=1 Tax=Streptomyces enissocaesilis TaxID=332589 RepID=A0ABN3X911_9ACTN
MTAALALRATWLVPTHVIARRHLVMLLRSPVRVMFGFTQPLIYVVLFGPFMDTVYHRTGGAGGLRALVPGLLLQLTVFSAGFSGYATLQERREGILDRQRVSRAAPGSLLVGRALANAMVTAVQAVLLTLCALPFGFRCDVLGAAVGIALLCVLNIGVSVGSMALAYRVTDETIFTPIVQNTSLPLVIISGVLLPLTLAPAWLRDVARFNPLSHSVDALRAAYTGAVDSGAFARGLSVTLALSLALTLLGLRSFARNIDR